jgi:hypothetical protein
MGAEQFWALAMFLGLFLIVTVVGVLKHRSERRLLADIERRLNDIGHRPVGQVVADRIAADLAERARRDLGIELTGRHRNQSNRSTP